MTRLGDSGRANGLVAYVVANQPIVAHDQHSYRCAMDSAWDRLQPRFRELRDLTSATALLYWDLHVMMPSGGSEARARAVATMRGLLHQRMTDPAIGETLEELASNGTLDEDQRASVRVLARDYEKAIRVPEELVRELAEATGLANGLWVQARSEDDFSIFQPILERIDVRAARRRAAPDGRAGSGGDGGVSIMAVGELRHGSATRVRPVAGGSARVRHNVGTTRYVTTPVHNVGRGRRRP